jgi:hypothetical protein
LLLNNLKLLPHENIFDEKPPASQDIINIIEAYAHNDDPPLKSRKKSLHSIFPIHSFSDALELENSFCVDEVSEFDTISCTTSTVFMTLQNHKYELYDVLND